MRTIFTTLVCLAGLAAAAEVPVTDGDVQAGQDVTWTANNTYILMEKVFVETGATLTIEPGTVIKGMPGQELNASALVICRGAKIYAEGTADNPIIFTSRADNLATTGELDATARGLWGGVLILGSARINTTAGEGRIEGIASTDDRGLYGGTDDDDNSGVLRFVSIRHGGTTVSPDNEINGLSMAAVGRGTVIDHVEVYNNLDDGFEWWGGTVNCTHLVSAYVGDDGFDYDEGWRGRGQFWFGLHRNDGSAGRGDAMGEHDGGTDPTDGTPYAIPVISNVTYVGAHPGIETGTRLLHLRDNAGGKYLNSIFTYCSEGIQIDQTSAAQDSYERFLQGDMVFANNLFWDIVTNDSWTANGAQRSIARGDRRFADSLIAWRNVIASPGFASGGFGPNSHSPAFKANAVPWDPRPTTSEALSDFADVTAYDPSGALRRVNYKGAFNPCSTALWVEGWTALDAYGHLEDVTTAAVENCGNRKAIIVDAPNGGEMLTIGEVAEIRWSTEGSVGGVKIEISKDRGSSWKVIAEDVQGQSHTWTPTAPSSRECLVRVTSMTDDGVSDQSNSPFHLESDVARSITVTGPGDTALYQGDAFLIEWETTGDITIVRIEVSIDGGETWVPGGIVGRTYNTGSYETPLGGNQFECVLLKVVDVSDGDEGGVCAFSRFFSLNTPFDASACPSAPTDCGSGGTDVTPHSVTRKSSGVRLYRGTQGLVASFTAAKGQSYSLELFQPNGKKIASLDGGFGTGEVRTVRIDRSRSVLTSSAAGLLLLRLRIGNRYYTRPFTLLR
jgi:hypothetical protein